MFSLSSASLLALVSIFVATARRSVVATGAVLQHKNYKRPFLEKQKLLSVRGGANGDYTSYTRNLATTASVVSLATGSASALLPASSLSALGMPSTPPLQNTMRRLGTSILAFGLLDYCTVFKGYSREKAVGISTVPWIADVITVLLMDEETREGNPMKAEYIGLVFSFLVSFAAYTGADYVGTVIKLHAGWLLLSGALLKYAPPEGPQRAGSRTDSALRHLNAFLGSCLLGVGFCEEALAYDVGILKAMACGSCFFALGAISTLFVKKESDELGIPKFPRIAWFLVFGGIGASLLLSNG